MSKAVLVMEMPEYCDQCSCFQGSSMHDWCGVVGVDIKNGVKSNHCPLKPLPDMEHNEDLLDEYGDGWTDGWNAFRKAILED